MSDTPPLTPAEAATKLRVTRRWVYALCARGDLRVIRFSAYGRIQIPAEDVERLQRPAGA